MSIAVQVHDKDPAALADLITRTMQDSIVFDREPGADLWPHLRELVEAEEREGERRRAAWHWLNSMSSGSRDRDNDWSDV